MPSSGLGAYQVKIHQILFGGLFFLVVLGGVRTMMFGGTANIKMLAMGCIVMAAMFALDKYYWVLFLAFSGMDISIPGLPFSSEEFGCILLIGVYFIRNAMHKEYPIKFNRKVLIAFPVFIWICAIWILNPTGMNILGSESIGARFYFQIVLGFLMLLVLSTFRFSEKDCKIMFFLAVGMSLFSFLSTQINVQLAQGADDLFAEEGQGRYDLLGLLTLYTLMLSRYRLSKIVTSFWKFFLVFLFAAVTVYTGKRRGLGTLIAIPLLRTFFTGKDKMVAAIFLAIGMMMLGFAIAGDGALWELPLSTKRSLSLFVPQYGTEGVQGTHDLFREEVRLRGREVMRANPWFGRKGFAMNRSETAWMVFNTGTNVFEGHAFSGNWHNTWYAFACDFGLPAMLMWLLFMFFVLFWTYQGFNHQGFGDYSMSVYMLYSFLIFNSAIFSYTSGHSASSSHTTWIMWGILIAIQNGVQDQESQQFAGANA